MATSIFNADSSEVTGTSGVVKSGSTYVLTGTTAQVDILADAGSGKAFDHSTALESVDGAPVYVDNSTPTAIATSTREDANAIFAFDTDLATTGEWLNTHWVSAIDNNTNQRLCDDRGVSPDTLMSDRFSNYSNNGIGSLMARGVRTFEVYGSNDSGDYTETFATNNAMVLLYSGELAIHENSDTTDWQEITYTTKSDHRYIIYKFYDNWGDNRYIGVRRIQHKEILNPTIDYDITDDEPATNYETVGNISAVQAVSNTSFQNEGTRLHLTGAIGDIWNSYTIDDYTADVTPPDNPVGGKSYDSDIWGMWWAQSADTTAVTQMRRTVDGTTTYLVETGGFPVWQSAVPTTTWYDFSRTDLTASSQINAYENDDIVATSIVYYIRYVDSVDNASQWVALSQLAEEQPDPATLVSATAGDTQVTLAVTTDTQSDSIYARYRIVGSGNDWSAESATFSRTGDGDIVITGLTNQIKYEFIIYVFNGGCNSDWSEPMFATPTDGSLSLHRQVQLAVATLIDEESYTTFNSVAFGISTEWPPRWEGRPTPTIFVQPDSFDASPGSTSTLTREIGINIAIFEQVSEDNDQIENRTSLYEAIQRLLASNTRPISTVYLMPDSFTDSRAYSAAEVDKYNFMTPFSVKYQARCTR